MYLSYVYVLHILYILCQVDLLVTCVNVVEAKSFYLIHQCFDQYV